MSHQLTIAQLIGNFDHSDGPRAAWNLAAALGESGARSIFITFNDEDESRPAPGGVERFNLRARPGVFQTILALHHLRKLIRKNRINILHIHDERSLSLAALAMFGMLRPPLIWFTSHQPSQMLAQPGFHGNITRWAIHQCEGISATSADLALNLARHAAQAAYLAKFPVPVDGLIDAGAPIVPTILWQSDCTPEKEPQMLIRAAAKLKAQNLPFRIVLAARIEDAQHEYFHECRKLIHSLNLADVISIQSNAEDRDTLRHIAQIAVQCSESESLSLTLLEQMMAGLAIVATDAGDTARVIKSDLTGLLIPSGHEHRLIRALRTLILDPPLRARLGNSAREMMLAERTPRKCAAEALAEYRRGIRSANGIFTPISAPANATIAAPQSAT